LHAVATIVSTFTVLPASLNELRVHVTIAVNALNVPPSATVVEAAQVLFLKELYVPHSAPDRAAAYALVASASSVISVSW
jgi:hypothetical protein